MAFCADTHTTESSALVPASCIQERENAAGSNSTFESPSLPVANSTASACMSPVSAIGSLSTISASGMATLNGIQIKEEFLPTDFRQLVENTLMSSFFANGGSTASSQSCLASIIQNFNSHDHSEKTISPSKLLPNVPIIKKEYDDCLPSTSRVHQPERQITTNSTDNVSTTDLHQPERQIAPNSTDNASIIDLLQPERQITTNSIDNASILDLHQPKRQIAPNSIDNASTTGDQTPLEPQVVDLTGDDDSKLCVNC